jgi:RHS repeat-associated protein
VITNNQGAIVSRHDYMPFGEEITSGTSVRSVQQGYVDDGVRQKFTGKERDSETGLDYFIARYYSSSQGRFTSSDPVFVKQNRLADPQRFNLYTYTRNNPLHFIDPDGEDLILANNTARERARANIDANLKANERGNIEIRGNKVCIIDPSKINLATASPAYKYLAQIIGNDKLTVNYYGLKEGESATATDGSTVTYDQAKATADLTLNYGNGVVDAFVPTGDGPQVEGENGQLIDFPENLVFVHSVYGHGLFGSGMKAVEVENEIRAYGNQPIRSGMDHEYIDANGNLVYRTRITNGSTTINAPITPVEVRPVELPNNTPTLRPIIPLKQP